MHELGHTRSAYRRDHLLQTPDTFVRIPLPCLTKAMAIVHTGAAAGAAFAEFTVEFDLGGTLSGVGLQRFVYVLEGELTLRAGGGEHRLGAGAFAYVPAFVTHGFAAASGGRAVVIERLARARETTTGGQRARVVVGREEECVSLPLMDDEDLQVRSLMPSGVEYDFAVNTMTYRPGAALSMVEVHVMEHGLLMLEGGGIYRLGDQWYPVRAGDFIWMAPFCPQWFGAIGKAPAKYLIYKDWNQHPLTPSGDGGDKA